MKLRHLIDGDAYAIYRAWRLGRYRKARRVQSAKPAGVQARQTASLPLYKKLGLRAPARPKTAVELAIEAQPNWEGFRYDVRMLLGDMVELQITEDRAGSLFIRSQLSASAMSLFDIEVHWQLMHRSLEEKRKTVPCSPELSPDGLPYILCSPGTTIDVDALGGGGVILAVPAGDPLPVTPPTPEQSALHDEWARMNAQLNTAQKSKWDEARNRSYALEGEIADTTGEIGMFAKLFKR